MENTASVNLLYVEDNRDLREALSALLAGEGYEVDVADCAGEGLERLRARRFHLVISDYALPDHTGAWMLREAAAHGLLDRTKTLLVTATADPEDAGGTPVLYKPLEAQRLLEHIAHLLAPRPGGAEDEADPAIAARPSHFSARHPGAARDVTKVM